jgi:hypothetical protein
MKIPLTIDIREFEEPSREMILAMARFGEISPSTAEKWIREEGFEPIPPFPHIAAFDPMQEPEWTLPMAAAWFIWHSSDAVRDQWMRYRRAWLDSADPLNLVPPMDVSLPHLLRRADCQRRSKIASFSGAKMHQ